MERQCTLGHIEGDLRARVDRLRQLEVSFDDEVCSELAYYRLYLKLNPIQGPRRLREYVELMREFYSTGVIPAAASRLTGQLGFLFKVYTGQKISLDDCREGSSLHRDVCKIIGSLRRGLDHQVEGWSALRASLQEELSDINPIIIENMMIDETFELLGRDMSKQKREPRRL